MTGLHPIGKRGLELLGIHQRHHPGQGVVAGHASRKITLLAEKIEFRVPKILNLVLTFCNTDHRTNR
jgi:hypothetical protein